MSQNPFQAPNSQADPVDIVPGSRPGGLTPISVISLILGAIGLFGSCIGLFGILAAFIISKSPDFPQQVSNFELATGSLFSLLNLVIAIALLVSSFGVLFENRRLARTLRPTVFIAAIFVLVRLGFGIVRSAIQFNREDTALPFANDPEQRWIFFAAILVLSVLWGLALLVYYIFAYRYLSRSEVRRYLDSF